MTHNVGRNHAVRLRRIEPAFRVSEFTRRSPDDFCRDEGGRRGCACYAFVQRRVEHLMLRAKVSMKIVVQFQMETIFVRKIHSGSVNVLECTRSRSFGNP